MNGNAEANYSLHNLKGKISFIPAVDNTLTKAGCAADAKETGKKISNIQFQIDSIDPSFAENVGFDNSASWTAGNNVQSALADALKQTEVYENSGYLSNHWSGENSYMLVGKICILTFNIQNGLSPAPGNTVFITELPKPKKAINFSAWQYDNDYAFNLMPCAISANGELVIHKDLTYQYNIAGTIAYPIA